ncbi:MAG: DUF5105 domain-containing protein [Clostridium sp.]|nr:DUF5105 domain-containing protein [Clostridium sp.]
MKKKLLVLAVTIMAMFALIGCGATAPKDVAKKYFEDVSNQTNSSFSKEAMRKQLGGNSSTANIPDSCLDAMIDCIGKMEVTVTDEKVDGEKATVNLKVKGVNLNTLVNEAVTEVKSSLSADSSQDEIYNKYFELVEKKLKEASLEERDAKINLTKSNDEWKVNESDADYGFAVWGLKTN